MAQGFAEGGGGNVNGVLANPLPCLYRNSLGSRRVFSAPIR